MKGDGIDFTAYESYLCIKLTNGGEIEFVHSIEDFDLGKEVHMVWNDTEDW